MKIGVLTSSRADYGIYRPLLLRLSEDNRFELSIIAFGMHLLERHGKTITEIEKDAFGKIYSVVGMGNGDTRNDITFGYGTLVQNFAKFWEEHQFDYVLALGDRWEMSAAVQSSIPFEVVLGHIHGGETTLGATDNIYRHQITLASKIHFTAAQPFSEKVVELLGEKSNIHTVGSISLDGFSTARLPEWSVVKDKFNIDFDRFVLVTFHPESVNADANEQYAQIVYESLKELVQTIPVLITKANADVMGTIYNDKFETLAKEFPNNVVVLASMGKNNYFKAMDQCEYMVGNTSSGIIEAASFKKWVINVGDRQKGRLRNDNVIDVPFIESEITKAIKVASNNGEFDGDNKYASQNTVDKILNALLDL